MASAMPAAAIHAVGWRARPFSAAVGAKFVSAQCSSSRAQYISWAMKTLSIPSCTVEGDDPARTLAAHLEQLTGLNVTIGFLYSVYETRAMDGSTSSITHWPATVPPKRRFLRPEDAAQAKFSSTATADIINRFVLESSIGNFGMYFGDETGGTVHRSRRRTRAHEILAFRSHEPWMPPRTTRRCTRIRTLCEIADQAA